MGQAAFVFIREALGPCGPQGRTLHPNAHSMDQGCLGCAAAMRVPLLAWYSLAGLPNQGPACGTPTRCSLFPGPSGAPVTGTSCLGPFLPSAFLQIFYPLTE